MASAFSEVEVPMLKKRWIATFVALVILAAGWFAGVQLAPAEGRDALAEKYAPLAGSEANGRTLVNGLREGAQFNLGGASFTPPTGKMGNGNIDIALTLAEAKLKEQGIAKPTAEQLRSALIGDSQHPGVLTLRAEGKGWGYIAHRMGLKLGDVVRVARHERPERPERHGR
jgi:hypothetical protein